MGNDLYFIPIIAEALDASDQESALTQAFTTIERLGQNPEYQQGFGQFQQFMDVVAAKAANPHVSPEAQDFIEALMVELATGASDTSTDKRVALDLILSRPDWRHQYEDLCAELEESRQGPFPVAITLERQGELARTIDVEAGEKTARVGDISPGAYTIRLSTGRVIWESELTEEDLTWSRAFPERALDLAAGAEGGEPKRLLRLLRGELVVRVFPGIETGSMEIVLEHLEGPQDA